MIHSPRPRSSGPYHPSIIGVKSGTSAQVSAVGWAVESAIARKEAPSAYAERIVDVFASLAFIASHGDPAACDLTSCRRAALRQIRYAEAGCKRNQSWASAGYLRAAGDALAAALLLDDLSLDEPVPYVPTGKDLG